MMTSQQVWGIVRTILAAALGYAAAKGYIDNSTTETILSAIGTIFIAVWSVFSKDPKPAK